MESTQNIKQQLIEKLIQEHCFWSYKIDENTAISDDILIEKTLIHLDIEDINLLFQIFSSPKIKKIWRERLVPQDDYYENMNRFIAWYYFDIKNPDQYIKTVISKHIKKICSQV